MSTAESNLDAAPAKPGRKRDGARDAVILDATLVVLAAHGYEGMTIDLVAAEAGMARATVYRRWATKADLVVAASERMSRRDVDSQHLPDTGSLRGDMAAMILPLDDEGQQMRMQAMAALMSVTRDDPRLAEGAVGAGIGPWVEVNRTLIERAVERGEFARAADVDTLAEVIPMLCLARALRRQPITRRWSLALIDGVILPALRGSGDS